MIQEIQRLRERRSELAYQALAVMPNNDAPLTAEQTKKVETIQAEMNKLTEMIKDIETRNARGAHNGKRGNNGEARTSLLNFMRFGETRAAMSTGSTSGGYLLNQELYPEIVNAQKAYAGLSTILKNWKTDTGVPVKVPMSNDTATVASDISDGAASTEVEVPLTGFISEVDEFDSGYVLVTLAELEDASYDVESWIKSRIMIRVFRALAAKLVTGGTNIQSVITTATNAAPAAAGSTTSVTYDDLVSLYSQLDPAYIEGASFVMNQLTLGALLHVKDTLGRPILNPDPSRRGLSTLFGCPVVVSPNHPSLAASAVGAIQFGNFSEGYTLRNVSDIHLFRLTERFLPDFSSYGYLAKARFGGFATNAGTNPVLNLVQPAS